MALWLADFNQFFWQWTKSNKPARSLPTEQTEGGGSASGMVQELHSEQQPSEQTQFLQPSASEVFTDDEWSQLSYQALRFSSFVARHLVGLTF
jgi:hypothetical protein